MSDQNQRPSLEVADIFRAHGVEYLDKHPVSSQQLKVMNNIVQCRTSALGGHIDECDQCGYTRISYNSCRDRHCPKCQSLKKAKWLTERLNRLLPVNYFHVVFTVPEELNPLMLRNKELTFKILFKAAAQTLKTIAADPRHLGAEVGFTSILHTWGQNLLFHPHLHCVVTGGGLSADGKEWISARENFFLPVKVLSKLFRGKFLHALKEAYQQGKLDFKGSTKHLTEPKEWKSLLNVLYGKSWVVYAKPPFGGAEQVFQYLGRYTHRVAISNHRLLEMKDGLVTFTLKDYAEDGKSKSMTLAAEEFIRRFLMHTLPPKFVRIRHYGLTAGRNVKTKLEQARRILMPQAEAALPETTPSDETHQAPKPWWEQFFELTGVDLMACPCCERGRLRRRPLKTEDLKKEELSVCTENQGTPIEEAVSQDTS